jgi:uncharacterized glyoxalase superfamily protein PhnB/uncharacterized protein YndB with AHSA1/START domain
MSQVYPYLKFNGTCRAAMNHYQKVLGGKLTLMTVGESPAAAGFAVEYHSRILHATLLNDGLVIQACDVMNPEGVSEGGAVSLSLNCTSETQIRSAFEGLAEGGKIIYPLKTEFWGALFGMVTDAYGKEWMLNYDNKKLVAEPGKAEVITPYIFDVPRARLFDILVQPELIPEWWGPAGLNTVVEKMEIRPGGSWRITQQENGVIYGFHGVYHSVRAPEQLVYTFEYEGEPGHVVLETITLEEHEGKTRMEDKMTFQSVADRDGMLAAGMEEGGDVSMRRLEVLLKTAGKGNSK